MKNKAMIATVLITAIFISFMSGVLFGRKTVATTVSIPENITQSATISTDPQESTILGSGILNINTATKEDLILLPGIGEVLAQAILDYRQANGPFTSVDELINVHGIGSRKLNGIIDYITVGG